MPFVFYLRRSIDARRGVGSVEQRLHGRTDGRTAVDTPNTTVHALALDGNDLLFFWWAQKQPKRCRYRRRCCLQFQYVGLCCIQDVI